MIPFVAAGGLLMALGFLFGGYEIANNPTASHLGTHRAQQLADQPARGRILQYLGAVLFTIGGLAFSFLVPALAGYIAFAIADRPGIAPGFTAGAVAVLVNAGFHRRHRLRSHRRLHRAMDQQNRLCRNGSAV